VADEVRRLKREPGQDLLLSGSGELFNALKDENLIDLYRLMVHPVILGKGERLFSGDNDQRSLKLVEVKPFKSGIVILEYEKG
jgi:dihydrofolate reductase